MPVEQTLGICRRRGQRTEDMERRGVRKEARLQRAGNRDPSRCDAEVQHIRVPQRRADE